MNSSYSHVIGIVYFLEGMAQTLYSSWCLDNIQQKDDQLTLITAIDIAKPIKQK